MAELRDRFIVGSSGSEPPGAFIYCSGGQDVVMPRDKRSCASTGCGYVCGTCQPQPGLAS